MWMSRPRKTRVRRCKLPGFFSTIFAPEGSVWSCPWCGDSWVVKVEPSSYVNYDEPVWSRKYLAPVEARTEKGCGSWSCDCGPHEKQEYDSRVLMSNPPKYTPLLCMEHRRHLPCRRCK